MLWIKIRFLFAILLTQETILVSVCYALPLDSVGIVIMIDNFFPINCNRFHTPKNCLSSLISICWNPWKRWRIHENWLSTEKCQGSVSTLRIFYHSCCWYQNHYNIPLISYKSICLISPQGSNAKRITRRKRYYLDISKRKITLWSWLAGIHFPQEKGIVALSLFANFKNRLVKLLINFY